MKQIYEKPVFEIIEIENKDIITYSYTGDNENYKNFLIACEMHPNYNWCTYEDWLERGWDREVWLNHCR